MGIDFTNLKQMNKPYGGMNGCKLSVVYNGEIYMLKFPAKKPKNSGLGYGNFCFSEYIGCKVYKCIGIPVQEVLLGTYTLHPGEERVVVACKDFALDGKVVMDFGSLKNQIIELERGGYGTELADIRLTIERQTAIDPVIVKERFWDMFIVDALIANRGRHNGNWGFLYDPATDSLELAPVFDCGSCLFPQLENEAMERALFNQEAMNARVYDSPLSAIKDSAGSVNYYRYISSLKDADCNAALLRITPRINIDEILKVVEETPYISDLLEQFYKTLLKDRYERIILPAYEKLKGESSFVQ